MSIRSVIRKPFRRDFFNATLWLIAANVLVYALTAVWPRLRDYLSLIPAAVASGYIWQPLTYMFAHSDISHLLLNMLGLFFFGSQVERQVGSREFLLYYLLTGLFAGLFSLAVYIATGAWYTYLLGASGAIFAILFAFAVINPDALIYLWGILPLRAPVMVLGYTAVEIVSQIFRVNSTVAHLTHLAGFGFGWLYFLLRFGIHPGKRLLGKR
jgi:membrane associated rhomboid family serine protease